MIDNGLTLACEYVDPQLLDDDEKADNLAELAAWKWREPFKVSSKVRSELDFRLAVSSTRRDEPDFKPYLYGSDQTVLSPHVGGAKIFMMNDRKVKRGFPLLIPMRGRLPSYEEFLAGEIDVGSVEPLPKSDKRL